MDKLYLAAVGVGLLLFSGESSAQNVRHGADAYKLCAGCHGFEAQGNRIVQAPALAAQESWYLERQLRNFRDGLRGHDDDDVNGQTMAKMMLAVQTDDEIADLVAYIKTLPVRRPVATVSGNADRGKSLYQSCAACHGHNAEGNAALNAPALVLMDDWYQSSQLAKFKDGRRGGSPRDEYGQQMVPMAAVLRDQNAIADVVTYIVSLRPDSAPTAGGD